MDLLQPNHCIVVSHQLLATTNFFVTHLVLLEKSACPYQRQFQGQVTAAIVVVFAIRAKIVCLVAMLPCI